MGIRGSLVRSLLTPLSLLSRLKVTSPPLTVVLLIHELWQLEGVVGLHPLNQSTLTPGINQYFLVSLLALANVPALRDYFLLPANYAHVPN